MYGDTVVIRRLAARLDERALDVRSTARSLAAAAEATGWQSTSGDRMKQRVAERRAELEATAAAYDEAAASLRRHADEVDEVKHLISTIERRVRSLISGAVDRLRSAATALVDGVKDLVTGGDEDHDRRLAGYATPPPGDRAWLDAPDELGVRI